MTLDKQFLDEKEEDSKANTDSVEKAETKVDTESEKQKNVENDTEDNAEKVKVLCPACNEEFDFKGQVPNTQKTFLCNCPKCGMEIKKENPNYTGW